MKAKIKVSTFGSFSISTEKNHLTDTDNHSKKIWMLLAYLICNRNRVVSKKELLEVLWSDLSNVNPAGALKTLLYRARAALEQLWEGAGMELILTSENGYYWNLDSSVQLDCEEFEELNSLPEEIDPDSLEKAVDLLKLYQGSFLQKFSSEFWVMSVSAYYHQIFIQRLLQVLSFLREQKRYDEIIEFTRLATAMEPFNEQLHCYLICAYTAVNKKDMAIETYQKFSEHLMTELGVMPSEDIRNAYREATKKGNKTLLTSSTLIELLREKDPRPGALICDFDFFRILYHSMARSVLRSGIAVHMILISINEKNTSLTDKAREKAMDKLKEVLRSSLRRGDSASQCSSYQYVVMLPRANYENTCMVCDRILRAYQLKTYKSGTNLHFEVFPLQPDEMEHF